MNRVQTVVALPLTWSLLVTLGLASCSDEDRNGSVLDNSIVLFGSGASTTHNPRNLPTLLAGGSKMGLKHGAYWRDGETLMSDMYLSILRSMKIEQDSFADSTGVLQNSIFSAV